MRNELHEVAVHAQDDEQFELLVLEDRVHALGEHVVRTAKDALAVGLGVESANLAVGGGGHQRDQLVSKHEPLVVCP